MVLARTHFDNIEEASFFDASGSVFGVRHLPTGRCIGGVVVCSPFLAEFVRNYRREVDVARVLAGSGIAVQRFHYFGTGRSAGESHDSTVETMVADALAAAAQLQEIAGDNIAFLGTRGGGLIAALAARDWAGAPVALWDPVADTSRYWREAFRAQLIYELKEGSGRKLSNESLLADLDRDGYLDVIGYRIDKSLYESVVAQDMAKAMSGPRPVLLVDINRSNRLTPAYSALVGEWRTQECDVAIELLTGQEAWWFAAAGRREEEARIPTDELFDLTSRWLIDVLSGRELLRREPSQ
jgi:hypothetical protein